MFLVCLPLEHVIKEDNSNNNNFVSLGTSNGSIPLAQRQLNSTAHAHDTSICAATLFLHATTL